MMTNDRVARSEEPRKNIKNNLTYPPSSNIQKFLPTIGSFPALRAPSPSALLRRPGPEE